MARSDYLASRRRDSPPPVTVGAGGAGSSVQIVKANGQVFQLSGKLAIGQVANAYRVNLLVLSHMGTLATTNGGKVVGWGDNSSGALGVENNLGSISTPATSDYFDIRNACGGQSHTLVRTSSAGARQAAGNNSVGQLGDGEAESSTAKPVNISTGFYE